MYITVNFYVSHTIAHKQYTRHKNICNRVQLAGVILKNSKHLRDFRFLVCFVFCLSFKCWQMTQLAASWRKCNSQLQQYRCICMSINKTRKLHATQQQQQKMKADVNKIRIKTENKIIKLNIFTNEYNLYSKCIYIYLSLCVCVCICKLLRVFPKQNFHILWSTHNIKALDVDEQSI